MAVGVAALGAACAVIRADSVLLVRHTYGPDNWELPGGLSLPGEDPLTTATRELHEETGLVLRAGPVSGIYYEPLHPAGPFLHTVFRIDATNGLVPRVASPEVSAAEFWPLNLLPRPLYDFTALRIDDARRRLGGYSVIRERRLLDPDWTGS